MDGSIDSVADSLIMGNEGEENSTDEDLLDQPEEESNEAGQRMMERILMIRLTMSLMIKMRMKQKRLRTPVNRNFTPSK